jgi:AcrR family transcriptional regulator
VRRGRHALAWKNVVLSRDEQFALKRAALLRQAARAFSAHGYHDTSLDDVAKALGVTKAALYYYVKNKQEILFECHMQAQDLGVAALQFSEENGRTGRDKILLLATKYIELITSEMGSFAVLTEFDALDAGNRTVISRRRDKFDQQFRTLVNRGIADGSIRPIDAKLTVFFFMGAINWMTRWFSPDGPLTGKEIARHFADLLDKAISAGELAPATTKAARVRR